MEDAKKLEFRIQKVIKHVLLKKDFVESNTISSKTNYTVTVCTNPSCTCQDNRKYGESVFCKHIMFIILKILGVTDEPIRKYIHWKRWLGINVQQYPDNDAGNFVFLFLLFFYFTSICDVHLEIYSSSKNNMLTH